MGGAASSKNVVHLDQSQAAVVKLMLPLYYTHENITIADRSLASSSWDMILNDTSPEFLSKKGTLNFPYTSAVVFFYDSFYLRLFDVHPMARALFKSGMKSQGRFLVQMISLALSEHENPEKFEKTLIKLAEVHNIRGVKAIECECEIVWFCHCSSEVLSLLVRWNCGRCSILVLETCLWRGHIHPCVTFLLG